MDALWRTMKDSVGMFMRTRNYFWYRRFCFVLFFIAYIRSWAFRRQQVNLNSFFKKTLFVALNVKLTFLRNTENCKWKRKQRYMLYEEEVLMISHEKRLFPITMTKLPILKTTGICRLLTLCQRSQNVLYCKNRKGFRIAYDVLYHFTNRPRPAHNLSSQKNLKTKIVKIVLTIYIMNCKKNVMACCIAWFTAKFPLTWAVTNISIWVKLKWTLIICDDNIL